MSVYSILFSPTGGTKKVTDALCAALPPVTEIDLCNREINFSQYVFTAADLCLISMPVYGGRFPALAMERFAQMRGDHTPCALVAVYGNRAIDDALIDLSDTAQANGFLPIAGVEAIAKHSLFPQVAAERPDTADRTQLADMGRQILTAAQALALAQMPGNRPYKARKPNRFFPVWADTCTRCGTCAAACPSGAIDLAHPATTDPALCIGCMRCVELCPAQARTRPAEVLDAAWPRLEPAFAGHKENVLYLAQ